MYKLTFSIITCATTAALPLHAATVEAHTRPLGVSVVEIPEGAVILANPYLAPAVCESAVHAVSDATVTLESAALPDVLSHPHYLEIYSGALTGTTVSIVAATADTVTLEHDLAGLSAGDKVRVRPHFTLASTFAHSALGDSNLPEVTLYDASWSQSNYSYSAEHGWYDAEGNADDNILYPAEGFIFGSVGLDALVFTGEVSSSPITVPLPTMTSTVLGTLNPAAGVSLAELGLVTALKDGDALGLYEPSGTGGLIAEAEFFFFAGWGFYDYTFNERNDYLITPLKAAVILRGPHPTTITLPPAFTTPTP